MGCLEGELAGVACEKEHSFPLSHLPCLKYMHSRKPVASTSRLLCNATPHPQVDHRATVQLLQGHMHYSGRAQPLPTRPLSGWVKDKKLWACPDKESPYMQCNTICIYPPTVQQLASFCLMASMHMCRMPCALWARATRVMLLHLPLHFLKKAGVSSAQDLWLEEHL